MRITNGMLYDRALRNLNSSATAMLRAQERLASGRAIQRPSDDPALTREAVKLRDSIGELEQYARNIEGGLRFVSAADAALHTTSDVLIRAREIALQGANASLSADGRQALALEVEHLTRSVVALANTRVNDEYLFAGHLSSTPPYAEPPAGSAAVGAYAGDGGARYVRIAGDQTVQINVDGATAFGATFAALEQLHDQLAAGTPVGAAAIGAIGTAHDQVLNTQAVLGARTNRLESTVESLGELSFAAQKLLANIEDADLPATVGEFTRRQAAFEAALAATARVVQRSLLDELR
jgi:flagellar hook-associated protein 3 FlgL